MYQEAFCTASFRLDFLPFTEARRQPKETSGTYGDDGAERPVPPSLRAEGDERGRIDAAVRRQCHLPLARLFALVGRRASVGAFHVTHIPADDSAREEGTVGQRDRLAGREHHARAAKTRDVAVRVELAVPVRCARRADSADQRVRKSAESCVTHSGAAALCR